MLQKIREEGSVNVHEFVKELRRCRCQMVQTEVGVSGGRGLGWGVGVGAV